MKEACVSVQTAELLLLAGFNEPTLAFYNGNALIQPPISIGGNLHYGDGMHYVYGMEQRHYNDVHPEFLEELSTGYLLAPIQSVVQKWLRDEFKHFVSVEIIRAVIPGFTISTWAHLVGPEGPYWRCLLNWEPVQFTTYEQALDAAILIGVKSIKGNIDAEKFINSL